jgi:hypothetical protein
MGPLRLILQNTGRDRDARILQSRDTSAVCTRIGITARDHHMGDRGRGQRICTRRGLAVMGARFQRDIYGGAMGIFTSLIQCMAFGMWPTTRLGPTPANHTALFDQHTADSRVRPHLALPTRTQGQRQMHPPGIDTVHPLTLRFRRSQLSHEIFEIVRCLEILVDAGKTHIGDRIDAGQSLHHDLTD